MCIKKGTFRFKPLPYFKSWKTTLIINGWGCEEVKLTQSKLSGTFYQVISFFGLNYKNYIIIFFLIKKREKFLHLKSQTITRDIYLTSCFISCFISDRVVDEMNPEMNLTKKEVESLLEFDETDMPFEDFSHLAPDIDDQVLKSLLLKHSNCMTKVSNNVKILNNYLMLNITCRPDNYQIFFPPNFFLIFIFFPIFFFFFFPLILSLFF